MKVLVLDNYDSFTYNLVHLLEANEGVEAEVFLNDKIMLEEVNRYDKILISPGPGLPHDAGILCELINKYAEKKDIFGVCLGMQGIGTCFGATLSNLPKVFHGIATPVSVLKKDPLFEECPSQFLCGRYHSWAVDKLNLPSCFEIMAEDEEGSIMALRHKNYKVCGVQFHPESILSEYGSQIIRNWIRS